jgi:hypothetical protein
VLAIGTQVRGFTPGQSRRIFKGEKILSTPFFGGEVKPSVSCCSFTACKRYVSVTCKSAFRQNYQTFLAPSSTLRRCSLSRGDMRGDAWWRNLECINKIVQEALKLRCVVCTNKQTSDITLQNLQSLQSLPFYVPRKSKKKNQ